MIHLFAETPLFPRHCSLYPRLFSSHHFVFVFILPTSESLMLSNCTSDRTCNVVVFGPQSAPRLYFTLPGPPSCYTKSARHALNGSCKAYNNMGHSLSVSLAVCGSCCLLSCMCYIRCRQMLTVMLSSFFFFLVQVNIKQLNAFLSFPSANLSAPSDLCRFRRFGILVLRSEYDLAQA